MAEGFRSTFFTAVNSMASELGRAAQGHPSSHIGKGGIAACRRMDLSMPPRQFWTLAAKCVPDDLIKGRYQERRWAAVVKGMSIMAPHHHAKGERPGRVLADARYGGSNCLRFERLVRARGDELNAMFVDTCCYLGQKARPVDWCLFAGTLFFGDDAMYDLAKDFYLCRDRAAA